MVENDLILSKNENFPFVMNDFFSNVISSLNIPQYEDLTVDINLFERTVLKAYKKITKITIALKLLKKTTKTTNLHLRVYQTLKKRP